MTTIQKITPFLWFDRQAEEAMNYYCSIFPNSRVVHVERYPDESLDEHFKDMSGRVITGLFELDGQRFMCLDGGPQYRFNEAVSFMVTCEDQAELTTTGENSQRILKTNNAAGVKISSASVGRLCQKIWENL